MMEKDKDRPRSSESSRELSKHQRNPPRGVPAQTRNEVAALKQLHELQVHQLELQMQNEELKKARAELDASLARYTALYESAPVVLLTLGEDSSITECNPAGATLLRADTANLLRRRLGSFVVTRSLPAFNTCLNSIFHGEPSCECDVELLLDDGSRLYAQITLVQQSARSSCVAAIVDITPRHELLEQNRALARRMFELLENDRRALGHEIHDDLVPWLSDIYTAAGAMFRLEHRFQADTRRNIRRVISDAAEMQNVLRRIQLKLRPTMLDTIGLGEGLRELVNLWRDHHDNVVCTLTQTGDVDHLGEALNITIFRIVQGALANVAKHAKASNVEISLERTTVADQSSPNIVLTIHDDGQGFNPKNRSNGLGLSGMRERAIASEGTFEIYTQPGRGTTIRVCLPVPSIS